MSESKKKLDFKRGETPEVKDVIGEIEGEILSTSTQKMKKTTHL